MIPTHGVASNTSELLDNGLGFYAASKGDGDQAGDGFHAFSRALGGGHGARHTFFAVRLDPPPSLILFEPPALLFLRARQKNIADVGPLW